MPEIDIRELKKAIDAIFDHISNDLKVQEVTLRENQDYYWEVPPDDLYAVKKPQPQLDVGRLSDDWEFLEKVSKDKRQALSLMLIHAAPLLRHIGQEIGH